MESDLSRTGTYSMKGNLTPRDNVRRQVIKVIESVIRLTSSPDECVNFAALKKVRPL